MKKLLASITIIASVSILVIKASDAFFSDTETSTGNTFVAGAFDLLVNNQNDPIGIVDITDLKPGDNYFIPKDLFVENDAYIFLHIKDIISEQNLQTEPEDLEESQNGIKHDLENEMFYDLKILGDPDEVLVDLSNENTVWEMHSCWIPLGVIPGGSTTTIEQSFHLPASVTNWAQGDKMTFTEEFYAEQVRNNSTPTPPDTGSGRVWNSDTKQCEDCQTTLAYASEVVASGQGLRKNGTPVLLERSDPTDTLGAPDGVGTPSSGFYSLGFGGSVTVKFASLVLDKPGDDLSFHEITNGRASYPEESASVEVSQDGSTWFGIGSVSSKPTSPLYLDFSGSGLPWILYVRLTDTSVIGPFEATADGYDVDAIDALNACIVQ